MRIPMLKERFQARDIKEDFFRGCLKIEYNGRLRSASIKSVCVSVNNYHT